MRHTAKTKDTVYFSVDRKRDTKNVHIFAKHFWEENLYSPNSFIPLEIDWAQI